MPRCPRCHIRIPAARPCPRDGFTPPAASAAGGGVPPRVEGFAVSGELGRGGSAVVWAATRRDDGAAAVIKVARAGTALARARFAREAAAMSRAGAPPAPALLASGQLEDGRPYLAMERVRAPTLAAWIEARAARAGAGAAADVREAADAREAADLEGALAVAGAVLAALGAVHARGVVHRDLSPDNVAIDTTGPAVRATLLDFGRACAPGDGTDAPGDGAAWAGPERTRSGVAVGTPEYMAPEQIRGEAAGDARTDLYAFGVILHELLALRPPFVGDRSAIEHGHLHLRPPRLPAEAGAPEAVQALVLACLAKDPAERPASAEALGRALAAARGPTPPAALGAVGSSGAAEAPEPAAGPAPPAPLIAEGRRLMALVAVETAADAAQVSAAVARRAGFVARRRGRRFVAVFSGADVEAPLAAALAAAEDLTRGGGARAAVHLAALRSRPRGDGPPAVYGAAVEQPETWIPDGPGPAVALTDAAARALPAARAPAGAGAEVDPLRARAGPPLVGRDDALDALAASASACFARGAPGLFTLLGERGLGKSRLTAEAAARVRHLRPDAAVIAAAAEPPVAGDPARPLHDLLRQALAGAPPGDEPGPRALAAALRARARRSPVAVVLDDAHWAPDGLLDALEVATLDGERGALWVLVAAEPRLAAARRGFGARAARHDALTLAPLDAAAGARLSAALLAPAEYPPAAALERLHGWAGGNPAALVELAAALKEAGMVRRRARTGSFYLATAALDHLPPSPAWQWLATRQLDLLPREIAACARLCAVLGVTFSAAELEGVQRALERGGGATTPVDARAGLRALRDHGLLEQRAPDGFAFRSAALRDALYGMLDPSHRDRVHQAALEVWRRAPDPGPDALERLAQHAAAAGAREEAAAASIRLAEGALAAHEHVAADAHATRAIEVLGEAPGEAPGGAGGVARARALTLRGAARYRISRAREALEDLAAAASAARAAGADVLLCEALLEQAAALDWDNDFAGSAERVDEARPIVARLGDRRLSRRLVVAEGRCAWRGARIPEAVDKLSRGAALAEADGDYEARVVALLLLACALVVEGRIEEAEARFDEVIALAASAKDNVHLCVAYCNRFFVWTVKKSVERAVDDLRRAVELAREVGNPWPERAATGNLAEQLFWNGSDDEAVELARRGRALEERFMERPVIELSLMLARLHAARGEDAEAAAQVAWIRASCPPGPSAPNAQALLDAVGLAIGAPGGASWEETLARSRGLLPIERIEALYFLSRAARRAGREADARAAFAEARPLLPEGFSFARRFAALGFDG
ncbi:protein kinase domain-containing protein [Sorangium sp. So ce131]|uniref:serine/threonine-protein kinase n=1 Tax=Sorangium sp. So ce131 TaxID=3133282 RepID=UPI003F604F0A